MFFGPEKTYVVISGLFSDLLNLPIVKKSSAEFTIQQQPSHAN